MLKDAANANLPNNRNWVHELNLDPRFRVAAGLGTKVVQKNQEDYMQAAWEQVGKVIENNNKFRFGQLALAVTAEWYAKHFTQLIAEKAYVLTAPVQKRVMYQNVTVFNQVQQSVVPPAVTSGKFRQIARPRGPLMKKLEFTRHGKAEQSCSAHQ